VQVKIYVRITYLSKHHRWYGPNFEKQAGNESGTVTGVVHAQPLDMYQSADFFDFSEFTFSIVFVSAETDDDEFVVDPDVADEFAGDNEESGEDDEGTDSITLSIFCFD
jgi:hypothetical protein